MNNKNRSAHPALGAPYQAGYDLYQKVADRTGLSRQDVKLIAFEIMYSVDNLTNKEESLEDMLVNFITRFQNKP